MLAAPFSVSPPRRKLPGKPPSFIFEGLPTREFVDDGEDYASASKSTSYTIHSDGSGEEATDASSAVGTKTPSISSSKCKSLPGNPPPFNFPDRRRSSRTPSSSPFKLPGKPPPSIKPPPPGRGPAPPTSSLSATGSARAGGDLLKLGQSLLGKGGGGGASPMAALMAQLAAGKGRPTPKAKAAAKAPPSLPPVHFGPSPPPHLTGRKLQWQTVSEIKAAGTVWENLISDDAQLPSKVVSPPSGPPTTSSPNNNFDRSIGFVPTRFEIDYEKVNNLFFEDVSTLRRGPSTTMAPSSTTAPKKSTSISVLDAKRRQNVEISLKGLGLLESVRPLMRTVVELGLWTGQMSPSSSSTTNTTTTTTTTNNKSVDNKAAAVPTYEAVEHSAGSYQPRPSSTSRITRQGKGGAMLSDKAQCESESALNSNEMSSSPLGTSGTSSGGGRPDFLTSESLQLVLSVYPTAEEEKALLPYCKHELEESPLAPAEAVLVEMIKIPRFKQRTECCLTHLTFNDDCSAMTAKLGRLSSCVTQVAKSLDGGALRSILALILRLGNYLNSGSNRGATRGFSLQSLENLKIVRSFDGSTTLLRYVCQIIDEQNPLSWTDLDASVGPPTGDAVDTTTEDIQTMLSSLRSRLLKVKTELPKFEEMKEEVFCKVFQTFVMSSEAQLDSSKEQLVDIEASLVNLVKKFGERGKTPRDGIDVLRKLHKFWRDLNAALRENREAEKKEKEKALRASRRDLQQVNTLSRLNGDGSQTARGSGPSTRSWKLRGSSNPKDASPVIPHTARVAPARGFLESDTSPVAGASKPSDQRKTHKTAKVPALPLTPSLFLSQDTPRRTFETMTATTQASPVSHEEEEKHQQVKGAVVARDWGKGRWGEPVGKVGEDERKFMVHPISDLALKSKLPEKNDSREHRKSTAATQSRGLSGSQSSENQKAKDTQASFKVPEKQRRPEPVSLLRSSDSVLHHPDKRLDQDRAATRSKKGGENEEQTTQQKSSIKPSDSHRSVNTHNKYNTLAPPPPFAANLLMASSNLLYAPQSSSLLSPSEPAHAPWLQQKEARQQETTLSSISLSQPDVSKSRPSSQKNSQKTSPPPTQTRPPHHQHRHRKQRSEESSSSSNENDSPYDISGRSACTSSQNSAAWNKRRLSNFEDPPSLQCRPKTLTVTPMPPVPTPRPSDRLDHPANPRSRPSSRLNGQLVSCNGSKAPLQQPDFAQQNDHSAGPSNSQRSFNAYHSTQSGVLPSYSSSYFGSISHVTGSQAACATSSHSYHAYPPQRQRQLENQYGEVSRLQHSNISSGRSDLSGMTTKSNRKSGRIGKPHRYMQTQNAETTDLGCHEFAVDSSPPRLPSAYDFEDISDDHCPSSGAAHFARRYASPKDYHSNCTEGNAQVNKASSRQRPAESTGSRRAPPVSCKRSTGLSSDRFFEKA